MGLLGRKPVEDPMRGARELLQEDRFDELEALARAAIAREPENADAWFWLGLALASQERADEALEAYAKVQTLEPGMIGAPMNAASILMSAGAYAEADRLLEGVMRDFPDRRSPLLMRVRSLLGLNEHDHARRIAEQAAGVEPEADGVEDWGSDLNTLGVDLGQAGLYDAAEMVLLRAVELRPGAPPYDNLGIVYGRLERPLDALLAFLHAVDREPDSARVYYNLARALSTLDPAIAACRKAIALDPDYPDIRGNLANLLDRVGRSDEAEEQFREAVTRYGAASDRAELANFLYSEDRYDEAETEALAALDMDASEALALRVVGDCHAVRGEYGRARTYYVDAAEKTPEWWLARWYIVRIDAIVRDKSALMESLEAAIQVDCGQTVETFENDELLEPYREDIDVRALLQSASLMGSE
jgi:superkiller protein 3